MYYPCSENKGADQLRGYCVFVFEYAKSQFSHDEAHIIDKFSVLEGFLSDKCMGSLKRQCAHGYGAAIQGKETASAIVGSLLRNKFVTVYYRGLRILGQMHDQGTFRKSNMKTKTSFSMVQNH